MTFCGLVAAMLASRDFKGIWCKRLPIFMAGADHACENAYNHDPTAKLTRRIDFVRNNEISAGSFSRET
jgi:hypothetical protein